MAGPTRRKSGSLGLAEGLKRVYVPLGGGTFLNASVTNNNNFGARGLAHDSEGYVRTNVGPVLQDWVEGTDVVVRVVYSMTTTGGAGEAICIRLGYMFGTVGEVMASDFDHIQETIDVDGLLWDTWRAVEFTIPAAQVVPDADIFTIEVRRRLSVVVTEYPNTFFLHHIELRYNAKGLDV